MGYYGNSQPNFAGVGKPYSASDILAATNAISGSLTGVADTMAKDRKNQQMSEANAYVSGLLGKGDRASILAAQSMLPYANERYGKQADSIMADIRQAESLKQAKEISEIDQALTGQKLSNDYAYNNDKLAQDLLIAKMDNDAKIKAAKIAASTRDGGGGGLTARDLVNIDKYNSEPVDLVWRNKKGKQLHTVVTRFQADNMLTNLTTGKPVKDADGKMVNYPDLKNIVSISDSKFRDNGITPYQQKRLNNEAEKLEYKKQQDSFFPAF